MAIVDHVSDVAHETLVSVNGIKMRFHLTRSMYIDKFDKFHVIIYKHRVNLYINLEICTNIGDKC